MSCLSHLSPWMLLPLLAVVCYVQNMAFTWSSRSRNSGDPDYHRHAAWCSNGVYIVTHTTFLYLLYNTFTTRNPLLLLAAAIVYTLSTTEGSVRMMRILLKKEAGKRAVGARYIYTKIPQAEWDEKRARVARAEWGEGKVQ